MSLSLEGRSALVTGSTAGIGFGIALAFGKAGAKVVFINGRTSEGVSKAIGELTAQCPKGTFVAAPGDVSTAEGCAAVFAATAHAEVDILVNNTGVFPVKDFFEYSDEEWTALFQTNVLSGIRCVRHYLKSMLQRNRGRVIFISSESAFATPPEMIHYGVTKTSQVALARGLANLCKGTRVTVNSVLPGPTRTPGVEEWLNGMATKEGRSAAEQEKAVFSEGARSASLKGSFLEVEEVANTVLFVASDLSSATTGASVRAEGGILNFL
jgi:NAD(P)-dependent dehydrogenase (short-subunit alcohol dehydrogenase family)